MFGIIFKTGAPYLTGNALVYNWPTEHWYGAFLAKREANRDELQKLVLGETQKNIDDFDMKVISGLPRTSVVDNINLNGISVSVNNGDGFTISKPFGGGMVCTDGLDSPHTNSIALNVASAILENMFTEMTGMEAVAPKIIYHDDGTGNSYYSLQYPLPGEMKLLPIERYPKMYDSGNLTDLINLSRKKEEHSMEVFGIKDELPLQKLHIKNKDGSLSEVVAGNGMCVGRDIGRRELAGVSYLMAKMIDRAVYKDKD